MPMQIQGGAARDVNLVCTRTIRWQLDRKWGQRNMRVDSVDSTLALRMQEPAANSNIISVGTRFIFGRRRSARGRLINSGQA